MGKTTVAVRMSPGQYETHLIALRIANDALLACAEGKISLASVRKEFITCGRCKPFINTLCDMVEDLGYPQQGFYRAGGG